MPATTRVVFEFMSCSFVRGERSDLGLGASGGGRWAKPKAIRSPPLIACEPRCLRARLVLGGRTADAGGDPLGEPDDRLEAGIVAEAAARRRAGRAGPAPARSRTLLGESIGKPCRRQPITFAPMRPERDNIAAPDLPGRDRLDRRGAESMPALTAAGPVLVHFFDFSQLNSVRTLPYLVEWDRRYREAGLTTIGVQAPRFPFGADRERGHGGARGPRRRVPGRDRRRARALARLRLRGLAQPLPLDHRRRPRAGSTSARANTWTPRWRSRKSCASSTRCARCRTRCRPCAPATPPTRG